MDEGESLPVTQERIDEIVGKSISAFCDSEYAKKYFRYKTRIGKCRIEKSEYAVCLWCDGLYRKGIHKICMTCRSKLRNREFMRKKYMKNRGETEWKDMRLKENKITNEL